MITQQEIHKKALVPWNSGLFLKSLVHGQWMHGQEEKHDTLFPITISFRTPEGKEILEKFETVRRWIETLQSHSREVSRRGYQIIWQTIQHRTLGEQQLPQQIIFATPDDWLFFIRKEREYLTFLEMVSHTEANLPELLDYLREYPLKALALAQCWPELVRVCQWFKANPSPAKYIRELEIAGVDTKFIEGKKRTLMALLPMVLPESDNQPEITGLTQHGFERKFRLKYDPPLVRLRLLDPDLLKNGAVSEKLGRISFSDISVPISELAQACFDLERVFITENKINGLSFPPVKRAMVIFGLGYGIEILPDLLWLGKKEIFYWGDIDTHGFAILSQLRGYFPDVQSILMDRKTLLDHRELWGTEDPAKRYAGNPSNLTSEEYALFCDLKNNSLGPNIRLEQERVRFSALSLLLSELSDCKIMENLLSDDSGLLI